MAECDHLDPSARVTPSSDGCEDCLRHQTILQRSQAILAAQMVEPADNFEGKVQRKIQQALREKAAPESPVRGWGFWRPTLISAASVALVVLVAGHQCAEAARQGDEGVGEIGHQGFPLVHRVDDAEF